MNLKSNTQVQLALKEINRGIVEIIDIEKIEELVTRFFTKGETFTVKAGFDPTAPDLHLGHTVLLHKLATFQKFGGIIQFLIGDFTAQIGDPTGKSQTRKQLTPEEIKINAKTFEEQVFKILDKDKTQVVFNSKWLNDLGSVGMLELTTHFNVARMLERDDFEKRHKSGISISISEFIYPLLQGFDSVHLNSDIEIGGTDQKFNLLMGRHLQGSFKLDKKQAILMMPILEGLDGVNKMSKSLNNFVAIKDTPNVMFDKIINISDTLMWRFFELLSDKTLIEIDDLKSNVDNDFLNPKHVKEMLAIEIISRFHSVEKALKAVKEAKEVLEGNSIPSDIKTLEIVLNDNETLWIAKAMVETGLVFSATQGRKDISASLLKINGETINNTDLQLNKGEFILQLGKKKFAKIILKLKD